MIALEPQGYLLHGGPQNCTDGLHDSRAIVHPVPVRGMLTQALIKFNTAITFERLPVTAAPLNSISQDVWYFR